MTESRKAKLSISLSQDLIARIDRVVARGAGATRSSVIEDWLRAAALRDAEASLAGEVIRYYETRTAAEKAEDQQMSHALSSAARRVTYDDGAADSKERGAARIRRRAAGRSTERMKRR